MDEFESIEFQRFNKKGKSFNKKYSDDFVSERKSDKKKKKYKPDRKEKNYGF